MDLRNFSQKHNLFMGLLVLFSVPLVSTAQQAATKHDVDPSAQSNVQGTGSTMTGPLILASDPTFASSPLAAATKNFVLSHSEVSVTDFGAVGDSATDNKAAFNNAILYAKANG